MNSRDGTAPADFKTAGATSFDWLATGCGSTVAAADPREASNSRHSSRRGVDSSNRRNLEPG